MKEMLRPVITRQPYRWSNFPPLLNKYIHTILSFHLFTLQRHGNVIVALNTTTCSFTHNISFPVKMWGVLFQRDTVFEPRQQNMSCRPVYTAAVYTCNMTGQLHSLYTYYMHWHRHTHHHNHKQCTVNTTVRTRKMSAPFRSPTIIRL